MQMPTETAKRSSFRRIAGVLLLGLLALSGCNTRPAKKQEGQQAAAKTGREKAGEQDRKSDWIPLKLSDFEIFSGKLRRGESAPAGQPTWREEDGVINCTGIPRGYLYSKQNYRNFELEFEYRFAPSRHSADKEKMNTGCLVYLQGEHRLWPVCLEVQGKWLDMGQVKSNARHIKVSVADEPDIRSESRFEPGGWNRITIRSEEGRLTVKLNEAVVCVSQPTELKEGRIGFQSEGWPVQFRRIRLRKLAEKPR